MNAQTALTALLGVSCALTMGCGSRDAGEDQSGALAPSATAVAPAAPTATPAAAPEAATVALVEENLAYGESGNTNLIGYLVMPADVVEPLPGLIVIHGPDGLDEATRELTRRLASERYIALAIDLYGGVSAQDGRDAATRAGALVDQSEATLVNIRQAYDYLTKYAFVPSVAAIGWASGGTWALRTGIALPGEVDAVVMYYGQFIAEVGSLGQLTAPVLGHFAGREESIPTADVQLFRERLRDAGNRAEIYVYPNAQQGFDNAQSATFNAASADAAWQRTVKFLEINL